MKVKLSLEFNLVPEKFTLCKRIFILIILYLVLQYASQLLKNLQQHC